MSGENERRDTRQLPVRSQLAAHHPTGCKFNNTNNQDRAQYEELI